MIVWNASSYAGGTNTNGCDLVRDDPTLVLDNCAFKNGFSAANTADGALGKFAQINLAPRLVLAGESYTDSQSTTYVSDTSNWVTIFIEFVDNADLTGACSADGLGNTVCTGITYTPIELEEFYFSLFDFDQFGDFQKAESREASWVSDFVVAYTSNTTELSLGFTSIRAPNVFYDRSVANYALQPILDSETKYVSKPGVRIFSNYAGSESERTLATSSVVDFTRYDDGNPTDPQALTQQQKNRAITFLFRQRQNISVMFMITPGQVVLDSIAAGTKQSSSLTAPRNFLFAGFSSLVYDGSSSPPPLPSPPPPSPPPSLPSPPPPSPPPPRPPLAGAAGNDPIFVGADGIPYRVDGQAGRAFNLVSSPCLSVNSEVQEVPSRFRYPRLGLTSTVFGSMHVSVGCRNTTERTGSGLLSDNSQMTRVDVRFDVLSGTILCRMPSKGQQEVSCDTVPGLQVSEYYRECNLQDMTCDWFPVSAQLSRSLSLAHVQPGMTQARLHIGINVIVVTRESLRQGDKVSCDDFKRWHKALEACYIVAQHMSETNGPHSAASLPEETIHRYLTILAAYRGMLVPAQKVFCFFHLAVEHLDARHFSDPALLHGLLGQRLLTPRPVPNRSTVIDPEHILKSAGAVNILVSDLGSQGEGFIEGTYLDYMVPSLDNHCKFPFSRFLGDEC
ncbi:hypothetical protein AB1Y20_020295 [Prymnesium parvum]|uniref:Uncharacterized protein n=1 Tax=Prymnesium parvum TaxID=97485 RepID=A0AB34JX68_PRYPA